MIEDYFGLIRAPFKLSADPYFFFDSATHRKALSYLQYGIQQAEGFVVITGETGVGKTTLVDHLLTSIDDSQVLAAKIDISHIERGEALSNVLSAFRIDPQGDHVSGSEALEEFLNDQYDAGRQVVLIVDEAQNLSPYTLEELRVLTNITREGLPLLQIFLIGQSEIKQLIARDDMEQFRQRIIASYHVSPLTRDETAAYIDHRMYTAGFEDEQSLFTDKAQDLIYKVTGGVPRKINKLCARVLLQTALDEKDFVDAATVQQVIDDFDTESRESLLGTGRDSAGTVSTGEDADQGNVVPFAGTGEASEAAQTAPRVEETPEEVVETEPEIAEEDAWQEQAINSDTYQQVYGNSRPVQTTSAEHSRQQESRPVEPARQTISGRIENSVSSVLDRLGKHRDEPTETTPAEQEDSFTELGRQLNESMKDEEPAPQQPAMQEPPAPTPVPTPEPARTNPPAPFPSTETARTRMDALKIDLNNFVNEVRDGLHDVETSMRTVSERVAEMEAYRESRSRLLHDRLQEIEILLNKLQGRK